MAFAYVLSYLFHLYVVHIAEAPQAEMSRSLRNSGPSGSTSCIMLPSASHRDPALKMYRAYARCAGRRDSTANRLVGARAYSFLISQTSNVVLLLTRFGPFPLGGLSRLTTRHDTQPVRAYDARAYIHFHVMGSTVLSLSFLALAKSFLRSNLGLQ